MTRGYEQAKNPLRVKEERQDDVPIKRCAHTDANGHLCVCTNTLCYARGGPEKACTPRMHKSPANPDRGTRIQEILQYLMFLCDSCLLKAHASAVNLLTFAAFSFV